MNKIKIILVDDHKLFIEGISAILKKEEDIEILATFLDAQKALDKLNVYKPELLITDISMPYMNGIEFIEKVKNRYPYLKILVVSMFPQIIPRKMIHGFILKDASSEDFIKAIRKIVLDEMSYFTTQKKITPLINNKLTKREKEIVLLIAQEKTVNEIAENLFISRMTVETHKKNIFLKLNIKSNAGLIKKAFMLGLIN
ncbi:response regulator transcription factor [uncultured Polaribacter sp.]|uniref:response regulator transcription factor n=1 Tax=uncultured Polaribacter sp. TaxID=174711 RepID=UPI00261E6C48|nr:response regulator transcription factor [uncultured Polaribacter sp.]